MHTLINLLGGLIGAYALLVGLIFFAQRSLMYHPGDDTGTPEAAGLPLARDIRVKTEDGLALVSWYLAPAAGQPVVLYLHGNAGTITDRAYKARILADHGIGVVLAEYRGYGGNPGRPSEAGLYADARANLAWLSEAGHRPEDVVIYGESLGTGVAVQAARELADAGTPLRGLVLEAPFTAMADAARFHYPWAPTGLLTRDRYASKEKIAGVGTPVLILHGTRDRTVPLDQGQRLFSLAVEPKSSAWLNGAGHADLYDFGAAEIVLSFVSGLSGRSSRGPKSD